VTARARRGLKLAAAAVLAALLVALTVNVAVDFWTPQAEVKAPSAPAATPAIEPAALQVPAPMQPPPPLLQQPAAAPQPQWNQPLFEPKFDGPGSTRGASGGQAFTVPDFSSVLNQSAPLTQVLPPSISLSPDPAPVAIRPIFGSKSGGVESGALGTVGGIVSGAGGTVSGATSGASSLLKR